MKVKYVVTNSLTLDVIECQTKKDAVKVQRSFKEQGRKSESPATIYTIEEWRKLSDE